MQHARTVCRLGRAQQADVLGAIREHPLGDEWADFAHRALTRYFRHTQGHIYLTSTLDHPGLIKLGKTKLAPLERMNSLSNESVIEPFKLLHSRLVHDRHWVEIQCHRRLTLSGMTRRKEFFPGKQAELEQCIQQVLEQDRLTFKSQRFYDLVPDDIF